jgi:hypothetical protein
MYILVPWKPVVLVADERNQEIRQLHDCRAARFGRIHGCHDGRVDDIGVQVCTADDGSSQSRGIAPSRNRRCASISGTDVPPSLALWPSPGSASQQSAFLRHL